MSVDNRILFVTPVSPFSAASGAEQRSALLLQALKALGTVDILQLAPGRATRVWHEAEDARNETDGRLVLHGEVTGGGGLGRYRPKPELGAALRAALPLPLRDYRLIVGRYLWSLCQLELPAGVPTLIDLDDFRYRYGSQAGWSPVLLKERLVKALSFRLARRQLHRFDAAFVVSERDQALLDGMPSTLLTNVPWTVPDDLTPVPATKRLLFVGSLWYRPNADGIDWFLARVWPAIRAVEPEATLQLVGPAPPARRAGWEQHPGVTAPGFVDDLTAAYAGASLVIVPVHSGGGSNIKVLEALAHGRPCVGTELVALPFGPELTSGIHWLTASDASSFAKAALSILQRRVDVQGLAGEGARAVATRFHRAAVQAEARSFAIAVAARQFD